MRYFKPGLVFLFVLILGFSFIPEVTQASVITSPSGIDSWGASTIQVNVNINGVNTITQNGDTGNSVTMSPGQNFNVNFQINAVVDMDSFNRMGVLVQKPVLKTSSNYVASEFDATFANYYLKSAMGLKYSVSGSGAAEAYCCQSDLRTERNNCLQSKPMTESLLNDGLCTASRIFPAKSFPSTWFMNVLDNGKSTEGDSGKLITLNPSSWFSGGNYTAPTTPGNYRIYFMAKTMELHGCCGRQAFTHGTLVGFQDFTVTASDLKAQINSIVITPGLPQNITATISNNGNAVATGQSAVKFQKATDSIGTNAVDIGTYGPNLIQIPVGGNLNTPNITTTDLTFPTYGNYFIRACADSNNGISESDENNNCSGWLDVSVPPPPTVTLQLSKDKSTWGSSLSVSPSEQFWIKWSSTDNALACSSYSFVRDPSNPTFEGDLFNGSRKLSLNTNSTLRFVCSNGSGSSNEAVVTVTVVPNPTVSLTASPSSILPGNSSTLTWSSTDASSCTASWSGGSTVTTSGTKNVNPVSATTYWVTCKNSLNNSATASVVLNIDSGSPDVGASAISPVSGIYTAAAPQSDRLITQLTTTISNKGSMSTGKGFQVLFQTASNISGGGATDISSPGSVNVTSAIPSGGSVSVTYPRAFFNIGDYYFRACADKSSGTDAGTISESDESNNCGPWTTFTVFGPDLKADPVNLPNAYSSIPTTISAIVSNLGNYSTNKSFTVEFQTYDSNNLLASPFDGSILGTAVVPAMAPGDSKTVSINYTFPWIGTKFIRACSDFNRLKQTGANEVVEFTESNNCGAWTQIIVSPPPTYACTNPPANANLCLGDDKNLTSNVSSTLVSSCSSPQGTEPKCEYTCKNGFTKSGSQCVSSGSPNLTAGSIFPTRVDAGPSNHIYSTITNNGTVSTGVQFLNLFQQADDISGTNPRGVGTSYNSFYALEANSSVNIDISNSTIDLSLNTPGTYYFRACADKSSGTDAGIIAESNETDNCGPWTEVRAIGYVPPITCVGSAPSNSEICPGDDQNLTVNTARVLASVCSSPQGSEPKCQYVCKPGYINSGSSCDAEIPVSLPDLKGLDVTPVTTVMGTPTYFFASMQNIGTAKVTGNFPNFFQKAETYSYNPVTKVETVTGVEDIPGQTSLNINGINPGSFGPAVSTASQYIFTTAGTKYMRFCTDKSSSGSTGSISESDENNNCGPWATITVTNPSLRVTLYANPTSIMPGGSSVLSWAAYNAQSCAAPWTTSTNTSGTGTVNPTVTTTYTITCTGLDGTIGNASATVTVGTPILPDLKADQVMENTATVGTVVGFNARIRNEKNVSTGQGFVNLLQKADALVDGVAVNVQDIASTSMTALGPLGSQNARFSYVFPASEANTVRYLRVCADKSSMSNLGVINEGTALSLEENNNCGGWKNINVIGNSKPDLTAGAITPVMVPAERNILFSGYIYNGLGSAPIPGASTAFPPFLSVFQMADSYSEESGAVVSTGGVIITTALDPFGHLINGQIGGGLWSQGLNPGESALITMGSAARFPASEIGKTKWVRLCADASRGYSEFDPYFETRVDESQEENNCGPWTQITITDGLTPTLTFYAVMGPKKSDPFTLYWSLSDIPVSVKGSSKKIGENIIQSLFGKRAEAQIISGRSSDGHSCEATGSANTRSIWFGNKTIEYGTGADQVMAGISQPDTLTFTLTCYPGDGNWGVGVTQISKTIDVMVGEDSDCTGDCPPSQCDDGEYWNGTTCEPLPGETPSCHAVISCPAGAGPNCRPDQLFANIGQPVVWKLEGSGAGFSWKDGSVTKGAANSDYSITYSTIGNKNVSLIPTVGPEIKCTVGPSGSTRTNLLIINDPDYGEF